MAFRNLLYYPGHTHSPLRLTRLIDLLPTRSLPPSLPSTQDEPSSLITDQLCFYSLTNNPAEQGSNRLWLVAVLLIGEDREGRKEDEMIKVATGYLRMELERLMYPGAIIEITSPPFEYAPTYESYTHFSDLLFSSNDHHLPHQKMHTIHVSDGPTQDDHGNNLRNESKFNDYEGGIFIPSDPTPTCYGQLELSFTESNLRKGMVKVDVVVAKDHTGILQQGDEDQSKPRRKLIFPRRRRPFHLQGNDQETKDKIGDGITNEKEKRDSVVTFASTPHHPLEVHPSHPSSSKSTHHIPTWKGSGWTILEKMDPRYRPFKDLVEARMVALEQQLMASDNEAMDAGY